VEFTFCTLSWLIDSTVPTRDDGWSTWYAGGVLQPASVIAAHVVTTAATRRHPESVIILPLLSDAGKFIRESNSERT
jgi:hypothetical protein